MPPSEVLFFYCKKVGSYRQVCHLQGKYIQAFKDPLRVFIDFIQPILQIQNILFINAAGLIGLFGILIVSSYT